MRNLKSPSYSLPNQTREVASHIRAGAIGVMPTDTIYGIVAPAAHPAAVERLYAARGRAPEKPCIILIASAAALSDFGIVPDAALTKELSRLWPGPMSIVLDCPDERFSYLHRGTKTLAFRVPKDEWLRAFLAESGPLLAPSANPEGKPAAKTIEEARNYFGSAADFYVDGGKIAGESSTLVRYEKGKLTVLRRGAGNVS